MGTAVFVVTYCLVFLFRIRTLTRLRLAFPHKMALIKSRTDHRLATGTDRLLAGIDLGTGILVVAGGVVLKNSIDTPNANDTFIGCTRIIIITDHWLIGTALLWITYVAGADVHIFAITVLATRFTQEATPTRIVHTPATHLIWDRITGEAGRTFVRHWNANVLQAILYNGKTDPTEPATAIVATGLPGTIRRTGLYACSVLADGKLIPAIAT
tara:strand:+ start:2425 stop:3063 length:639 start_codon:yes stop_codon:yes gene_type:complete